MMEEACHEACNPPLVCPDCSWIATIHFNGEKVWRPDAFFAAFVPDFSLPRTDRFQKEQCDWCKQRSSLNV